MSFGAGAFGAVPFGASFGAGPAIRLAWVSARNAIDVEFDSAVQTIDATIADDGLNPANWTLAIVTAGAFLPFIQTIEAVEDTTIRVYFDADLTDGAQYEITVSANVLGANGLPVSSPRSAVVTVPLLGFVPVTDRIPRELRVDFQSTAGARSVSGTLRYDETGDLANESGPTYLRKRILRRVSTVRGSIFHLPNYGAGQPLKTLITPSRIATIRADVLAQVLLEPDVLAAIVQVVQLAPNILRIVIQPTNVQGEVLPEIVTTVVTDDG